MSTCVSVFELICNSSLRRRAKVMEGGVVVLLCDHGVAGCCVAASTVAAASLSAPQINTSGWPWQRTQTLGAGPASEPLFQGLYN